MLYILITSTPLYVMIGGLPLPAEITIIIICCFFAVIAFKAYIKHKTRKQRGKVMWLWYRLEREYKRRKSSESEYSPFHGVGVGGAGMNEEEEEHEEKGEWNGEGHTFERALRR